MPFSPAAAVELGLELVDADALLLGEDGEGKRQDGVARHQNETEVDGHSHAGALLQPLGLLQTNEDKGRDDHDGRGVEDAAGGRLADGYGGSLLAAAEGLDLGAVAALRLLLLALLVRDHGEDVNALADLLAAHEKDVEGTSGGHGGEGNETGQGGAGRWREGAEAGDELVEADGDTAGDGDGHGVGLAELAPGQGGGFVRVCRVDCDVEGLVDNLPCDCSCCLPGLLDRSRSVSAGRQGEDGDSRRVRAGACRP